MTGSKTNVGADRVRTLADLLWIDVTPDEADRFAAAIDDGIERYDALPAAEPRASTAGRATIEEFVFDPDHSTDPHNAYISRFRMRSSDSDGGRASGLAVAVKDNIAVGDVPLTAGSRVFEGVLAGETAPVVDRLLGAGARIVGKTNMDELAYGPTGETSGYGPVSNPTDADRVAGGSSAGSAAVVAAGDADAALGSDTGGSVRIPAAFCGVVGFKPSWGLVPRTGLVEMAPSLDTIGPIGPDVATAARTLDVVAGPVPRDPASRAIGKSDAEFADRVSSPPPLDSLAFGVPDALLGDHVDGAVRTVVEGAIESMEAAGATVDRVTLPALDEVTTAWDAIANVEFAAGLLTGFTAAGRRFRVDPDWHDAAIDAMENEDSFGDVVRGEAIEGAALLDRFGGRHYVRARLAADRLRSAVDAALQDRDALVAPTVPVVAPPIGEWDVHSYAAGDGVPLSVNVRAANLVGGPAITLPCGDVDGLPVGLQLFARPGDDARLLATARAVEALAGWT